jgi:hypothetical protein
MSDKHYKLYRKPELMSLGDLRTLTLGGSPGVGDSGATSSCEQSNGKRGPLICPDGLFLPNHSSAPTSLFPPDQTPNP